MEIKHDLIASVVGPGWKYGLSRILINENNRGAVFVAGSQEPIAEFDVTALSTSRGTGTIGDDEVTWRRRGSSCQYKLAKCKVSTATMQSRWETYQMNEPADDEPADEVLEDEGSENDEDLEDLL